MTSNHWVDLVLRPLLVAAMLACLVTPVAVLFEELLPGWDGAYFLVCCFLANLEGILSERLLSKQRISGWGYIVSRAAEALILWLLLKLAGYVPLGWDQLWADALRWAASPEEFLTVPDFLTTVPFLAVWLGSIYLSRLLGQLDVVEDKPPPDRGSTEYYLWLTQPSLAVDRNLALEHLSDLYFMGGAGLLLGLAGLLFGLPDSPLPVLPSLGYFALGIVLLSQAQFSVLQAGWQIQRIEVRTNIARRWLLWATLFLAGVTLVAMVLPTGYTVGPLYALLGVLTLFAQILLFVPTLLFYLFAQLLSWLFPTMQVPEQPSLGGAVPPAGTQAAGAESWLQIVLSALFWIILFAIAGYALIRFLRERLGVGQGSGRWWERLLAWLRGLWQQWHTWQQEAQTRLGQRRARGKRALPGLPRPGRFMMLRRLSPRDLVRYFYLSALRRAAQAGQPRRPAQTPYEYRADLDGAFPELEPDLSGLTEAFIVARYSPQPVQPQEAQAVKPLWRRIKEALQRRMAH
jgi:hypothetical protein